MPLTATTWGLHHDEKADGLMRSVVEHPFDVAVRLILADRLDEVGEAERAEFIRLQCEGAEFGYREVRLFDEWKFADWFLDLGEAGVDVVLPWVEPARPGAIVRNGFVGEVRCPMAWWMGTPCEACHGNLNEVYCGWCQGTGFRTPGHGAEVVSRHPVTRVVVTSPRPQPVLLSGGYRPPSLSRDDLPAEVFERLEVDDTHFACSPGRVLHYTTDAEADDAMSRALVGIARWRAGLPAIPWEVSQ